MMLMPFWLHPCRNLKLRSSIYPWLLYHIIKEFECDILKMAKLKFLRNKENNDEKSLKVSVPVDHKNHPPPPPPGAPLNGQMRDNNWMNSVSSLGFK